MAIELLHLQPGSESMQPLCQIGICLAIVCTMPGSGAQNVATVARDSTGEGTDTAPAVSPVGPRTSQMILGPSDVIHINVWKNTDVSETVTVGPDGFVALPLLGALQVSGLTAKEVEKLIGSQLATYIVNPQVTVSIVDIRSRQVYILGQVSKPGSFPLIAPVHVLQLIAQAGGLTTYANRKGIVVLRPEEGTVKKIPFNYNRVIRGDGKQNIMLQPGDTVVVP